MHNTFSHEFIDLRNFTGPGVRLLTVIFLYFGNDEYINYYFYRQTLFKKLQTQVGHFCVNYDN